VFRRDLIYPPAIIGPTSPNPRLNQDVLAHPAAPLHSFDFLEASLSDQDHLTRTRLSLSSRVQRCMTKLPGVRRFQAEALLDFVSLLRTAP
jgi:hypothetical protein